MSALLKFDREDSGGSVALPPYRAVLAVDIERYSRNAARHQQLVSAAVPEILEEAFRRSGLLPIWEQSRFPQRSGDGYVIGVLPENLPFLIHPVLENLQRTLNDVQPQLAARDRDLRLRLRASIDVGPLPDSGSEEPFDGIGEAMNHTHRLLDSPPVREELDRSDPNVTLLAAIVSRRVYEDAVLGGFTGIPASRFQGVQVDIPAKEFKAEGYLHIPQRSTRLAGRGAATAVPAPVDGASEPAPAPHPPERDRERGPGAGNRNNISGNVGNAVQGHTINGGVRFGGGDR
ncbi:hypothetical protein [Actinorugispora endophytica]|uniref:Uncharacterized protein n=1 Tax=Actinorugispora endophytica TaxID=1605990 RepID=A0A4R6UD14_9ACTN|nr:hypothetical protein [Actinorugispora endophytica]TDQ43922.1 hypothetical protein EV190_13820 [Actinorugispora endophytica]